MIEVFYYSIAGKKTNPVIDDLVQKFLSSKYLPASDRKLLLHTQKVSEEGNYPSSDYYSLFYPEYPAFTYRSLAEISNYCNETLDFFHKQFIEKELVKAINDTNTAKDLLYKLQLLSEEVPVNTDLDVKPVIYGELKNRTLSKGIKSGIKELDDVTFGFQPGTVASICAFTAHGKSTLANSIAFKSALEGEKVCIISLELAPDIIWPQFEARYMFQVKGLQISAQDIQFRKVPSDVEEQLLAYEQDFQNEICQNLMILDESYTSKSTMLNYKAFSGLMRQVATKLGGLDLVIFDHVGQFELMFPDCGNQIIKSIQSFTKTFQDERGRRPVSIMCVQTNRQGEMRARKRNGVYDIQAISELSECASSHTIVHTEEGVMTYGQVVRRQKKGEELHIESVDYSTGEVVKTRIVDSFANGRILSDFQWRKLSYEGGPSTMIFTPNHRFLIDGKKVALKDLPLEFEVDYVDYKINDTAEQVIIGTLLGDSVINKTSKQKVDKNYHLRLMQGPKQENYLRWKVAMLAGLVNEPHQDSRGKWTACSKSTEVLSKYYDLHPSPKGFKDLSKWISKLDKLGLLVWYLDDGCLVRDSKNSYHCTIGCTNIGLEGAKLAVKRLEELGYPNVRISSRKEPRSSKDEIQLIFHNKESRKFLQEVSDFIDVECINYKLIKSDGFTQPLYTGNIVPKGVVGKKKVIQEVFYFNKQEKQKPRKKYNFEVENKDHNYVLPGGIVSANCERTSTYVVFMYTSDDMKIMQETKITLAKHRLGSVITEPIVTTFNPAVITVGAAVESVTMSDDDFMSMDLDLGGGFDEFG